MEIIKLAITFFFITNPIGNSPAILAMLKDYPMKRQKSILLRETLFALILAFFFQFLGEVFLSTLKISNSTVSICGGVLLFIVAINMIYPRPPPIGTEHTKREPYFVPIATPLLAGPSLLTIIMLYSQGKASSLEISAGILVAWVAVGTILFMAPYLQTILKKRGMIALEQLMGLIVTMISVEMMLNGIRVFIDNLHKGA